MFLPVEPQQAEDLLCELTDAMRFARCDDEIRRLFLLKHEPHRLHIVACKAPVALGIEVAKEQLLLQTFLNARGAARDLACYKRFAASRALVIKKDAVACEYAVGLAVVHRLPKAVDFAASIWATR